MRGAALALWLAGAGVALGLTAPARAGADAGTADAGTSSAAAPAQQRKLPRELEPQIEATLSPREGLVTGDVVTLTLRVTTKPGVDVAVPEQSFAPLELIDRKAKSETAGQTQRHEFELTLLALEPGTLTFPGVNLRVVGPHGELGDVRTPAETLQVGALLANEPNAEPKPETKPVVVMQDDFTLAWIAGGLLAAALLVAATLLVSRWLKRRPKAPEPAPPPRPAWDVAVEKLLLLEREKQELLASERGEEFIARVSDTLREYLGRRYGFDGLESTTDEIVRRLSTLRPHKLSLPGVSLLLEQCDLVKFARAAPDLALCDDLWNGAIGLVRATIPPAPEAPAVLQGPAAGDARAR
jgi:hypothetical protein